MPNSRLQKPMGDIMVIISTSFIQSLVKTNSFLSLLCFLSLLYSLWPAQIHHSSSAGPDLSSVLHKALACRWKGVYSRIRELLYMPQWLRNALLPHSRKGSNTSSLEQKRRHSQIWTAARGSYCKPHVKMFMYIYFGEFRYCMLQRLTMKERSVQKKFI